MKNPVSRAGGHAGPPLQPLVRVSISSTPPPLVGVVEKASLRLGLTFAFVRHSGESRNPFLPFSSALRPDILAPSRRRYGRRHIYPPHPFRIRARRALPRVGIKCKNESKNHKMDSGFRRNDGGFPALRGFFNSPLRVGLPEGKARRRGRAVCAKADSVGGALYHGMSPHKFAFGLMPSAHCLVFPEGDRPSRGEWMVGALQERSKILSLPGRLHIQNHEIRTSSTFPERKVQMAICRPCAHCFPRPERIQRLARRRFLPHPEQARLRAVSRESRGASGAPFDTPPSAATQGEAGSAAWQVE